MKGYSWKMFMRFVITRLDDDSHRPQGVLSAAYDLLASGELNPEEWKRLREILNWFNTHLPHPPNNFSAHRAIFWFKSGANIHIAQVWEIIYLLRLHGHHVEVHKCRYLANICWQDHLQVAAFPSDQNGRITVQ